MASERTVIERRAQFSVYLIAWFKKNHKNYPWRKTKEPYKIFIAEIMLRKTNAEKVLTIFEPFVRRYPEFNSLARASPKELEENLRPLGLYRLRAEQLKRSAETIVSKFDGQLPNSKKELLELPGVGNYIANAILCFAFNQNVPILDTNIIRIIARAFSQKSKRRRARNDPVIWQMVAKLIPDDDARSFNLALLDLVSIVCTPKNPRCSICPVVSLCNYGREVLWGE